MPKTTPKEHHEEYATACSLVDAVAAEMRRAAAADGSLVELTPAQDKELVFHVGRELRRMRRLSMSDRSEVLEDVGKRAPHVAEVLGRGGSVVDSLQGDTPYCVAPEEK